MQIDDIVIGEEYKVRAPNATGKFLVVEKRQNNAGHWEITAKSCKVPERPSRTFSPDQILAPEEKPSNVQRIISTTIATEQQWDDGTQICIEEVTYWPNWARRGRKPAQAA